MNIEKARGRVNGERSSDEEGEEVACRRRDAQVVDEELQKGRGAGGMS